MSCTIVGRPGRPACAQTPVSRQRRVPCSSPVRGIAFGAAPAVIRPQTMADPGPRVDPAGEHGRHLGDHLGQARRRGPRSGAGARCGRRARSSRTSTMSAAEVIGPGRVPITPDVGARGRSAGRTPGRRRPARRPRSRPSAPPGWTSSAGWKISRTRPGSRPSSSRSGQHQAGAEHGRGVHVVAARVRDARHRRGVRQAGLVRQRQGVEVGPQRHRRPDRLAGLRCRRAAPVPGSSTGSSPASLKPVGDALGGAELGPADLRVGVQVAPEGDQLVDQWPDDAGQVWSAARHEIRL